MHDSFHMITPALEQGFKLPCGSASVVYKDEYIPAARFPALLLTAMEAYTIRKSYAVNPMITNIDLRRDLALIRRVDYGQFCTLFQNIFQHNSDMENLLSSLLLSLTLTAHLAQRSSESAIRNALDFIIPEYQDMLYRLTNAMIALGVDPHSIINLLGGHAEIMPGRPMIACHRHPYDDVAVSLQNITFHDHMALIMMAAVEMLIADRMQLCMQRAEEKSEKALFMEFSMIAEQHMSFLTSLLPHVHPLETLLYCHFTEAFLYDSCASEEENQAIRQFFLEEKSHELAHIKKTAQMIQLETGRHFTLPAFPAPLQLTPQKGYIRDMLKNLGVTLRRGKSIPVGSLKKGADFFRYQKKICTDCQKIPSHQIIMKTIQENGTDFRYEIAPHPVQLLRDREMDHTDIGR